MPTALEILKKRQADEVKATDKLVAETQKKRRREIARRAAEAKVENDMVFLIGKTIRAAYRTGALTPEECSVLGRIFDRELKGVYPRELLAEFLPVSPPPSRSYEPLRQAGK